MVGLLKDYKKFERIANAYKGDNILDASNENFLAPTTVIPLLCFIKQDNIKIIKLNDNTKWYIKKILEGEDASTLFPYQILPYLAKERQNKELSLKMAKSIKKKWGSEFGGFYTLRYIITELTNNIYDHTPFEEELASQGYIFAQEYKKSNQLDICIMDDGLSIPGRFEKSGKSFRDGCHAIELTISNNSTVSEDSQERGNGLWSTIKLVIEGNKGSVLIVSGDSYLSINSKNYKYGVLDNKNIFKEL